MNHLPQVESILGRMVLTNENASPLPLKKTVIQGQVTGPLVSVLVTQQFSNPYSSLMELFYLFPLPSKAAIVDFELHIGSRRIQADIQELEQARQAYEDASRFGKRAGLLEQRRPNLFAIRLTNVQPGETIEASIRFQDRLKFEDGAFEVVFPMGLTPRYNTPDHPEESAQTYSPVAQVGDEIGKVEISLAIDAGASVTDPTSPTHPLRFARLDERRMQVTLDGEHIPNHDFVLRYSLQGENAQAYAWTSHEGDGDYLLAALFPPAIPEDYVPPQREFVFVLDRSGSMTGEPIAQARNALRACLRSLNSNDTFRILLFDDKLEWYSQNAASLTQREITQADQFIGKVEGRGGTEILLALQAVFDLAVDPARSRYIVFLTDGAVSAEERALQQIQSRLGKTRLFTFGIGPSVNRSLLEQMAGLGRGMSEFLQLDEDIEGAIIHFQDRVSFPVLTDLSLVWEGAKGWDIYPHQLPDLFASQPIEICGRFTASNPDSRLILRGKRGGQDVEINLPLQPAVGKEDAIRRVWNRARIDALLNLLQTNQLEAGSLRQEIIALALQARLVTQFTSFVAIDHDVAVNDHNAQRRTIQVAQPLPKGLERSGFFAPTAPMMSQSPHQMNMIASTADLDLPAFLRRSSTKKATAPLQSISQALRPKGRLRESSVQIEADQRGDVTKESLEEALRWLARTQQINGSWNDDIEQTSAALLAFVRHGQTTRSGNFRQIVKRAFSWLESQSSQRKDAFVSTLIITEMALATQQPAHQQAAASARADLPAPVSLLEKVIIARIEQKSPPVIAARTEVNNMDDLRLYAVLKLPVTVASALLEGKEADLARTWSAVLK